MTTLSLNTGTAAAAGSANRCEQRASGAHTTRSCCTGRPLLEARSTLQVLISCLSLAGAEGIDIAYTPTSAYESCATAKEQSKRATQGAARWRGHTADGGQTPGAQERQLHISVRASVPSFHGSSCCCVAPPRVSCPLPLPLTFVPGTRTPSMFAGAIECNKHAAHAPSC